MNEAFTFPSTREARVVVAWMTFGFGSEEEDQHDILNDGKSNAEDTEEEINNRGMQRLARTNLTNFHWNKKRTVVIYKGLWRPPSRFKKIHKP